MADLIIPDNRDILGYPPTMVTPQPSDYAYSRLLPYIKMQMPSYIIGKHHRLIAHYLQKLESGEVTRLAIFMPPRH